MTDKELHKLKRAKLISLLITEIEELHRVKIAYGRLEGDNANLQDEVEHLKKRLDEKDEKMKRLVEKLDEKDSENTAQFERLKAKLDEKDEQIEHLKKRLEDKDRTIAQLKNEI